MYIAKRGEKYRSNAPVKIAEAPININPAIRNGVYFMHKGGKMVAKVTQFLRMLFSGDLNSINELFSW